jgi:hypothetical protein
VTAVSRRGVNPKPDSKELGQVSSELICFHGLSFSEYLSKLRHL